MRTDRSQAGNALMIPGISLPLLDSEITAVSTGFSDGKDSVNSSPSVFLLFGDSDSVMSKDSAWLCCSPPTNALWSETAFVSFASWTSSDVVAVWSASNSAAAWAASVACKPDETAASYVDKRVVNKSIKLINIWNFWQNTSRTLNIGCMIGRKHCDKQGQIIRSRSNQLSDNT